MDLKKICRLIEQERDATSDVKKALTEMLQLYSYLYQESGKLAVKYGNGTHPKHRVTKYHDFFVNNVYCNESVLDLGSGRGDVTYDVAKKTIREVIGVELNPNNVQYAKTTYSLPNLTYVRGNIYTDIVDEHFDVVIMSNVLEHLKDRTTLLKMIMGKVTPNRVLFRVPQFEREWTVSVKKELGLPYFLDGTHEIEYTHEEFAKELDDAGLKVNKMQVNWGEIWAVAIPKDAFR